MPDGIQVLHVDDEPDFAFLTATYLEREYDRFTVETAASASEGLNHRLAEVDCVISDYDMPGMNGIDFLNAVREDYPDLPFILFTGKGSEEIASDAISAGVTDYLQKESSTDQYAVLANRVTNAVAQNRAEHQVQEERERFQILFDRLTQPTVEVEYEDDEPIVLAVNPAFEEVFGYDAAEIEGNSLDDYIVPPEKDDEASQINQRVQAGGGLNSLEVTRRTADGNRDFLLQNAAYDDGSGGFAIYTDITDRKQREQEVERQNARLSSIFENLPEPTLAYAYENGDPYIRAVNEAFTETFGYDASEAVDAHVDNLLVPPESQSEAAQIDERVKAGETVDELLHRQTQDGLRDFRFRNIPLPDDESIDGYGIYADVTERREREKQLRQAQQRFQTLFEQLTQPLVEVEYDGLDPIVTDVNPAFEETFGYDASAIVGDSLDEYIVPDDRQDEAEAINAHVREGGRLVSREVTRQTVDGLREFLLENAVYDDGSGGFAIYTDITDRKQRVRDLEQYETLVEVSGDPMYMLDAEGHIEYVNEKFVELSGYREEALLGEHIGMVMDQEDLEKAEERIKSLLAGGDRRGTFEMEAVTADDDRIPAESHISLLYDEGEFSGSVGVMRVITERLARQRRLKRERDRFEEFANVLSHDLRNPLSVATGRLELVKEECDSEHLEAVEQAQHRMQSLIDDMLSLAKARRSVGETEAVELDSFVESCWQNVKTPSAGLDIQTELTILADKSRFQQLVENLLRNAVEHGGRDVTVTIGELSDGFYVEDDGVGIPPGDREEVFAAGYSSTEEGTGFGLNIVRDIAEAHQWEVSLTESAAGGTRFEFTGIETP